MKKTYEILKDIYKFNPAITHFLLRLYKHQKGMPTDPNESVQYSWISVNELKLVKDKIEQHEEEGWLVGLTSLVMTHSGIQHLLMLDYSITPSKEAQKQLISKISTFNKSGDVPYIMDGYIIQTKNSYHYLSKFITSEENFINFLGSALLFRHSDQSNFVVDDRWLGHSIKRKFGVIRLGQKEGVYPEILKEIK